MGIFDGWSLARRVATATDTPQRAAAVGIVSPWQEGSLSPVVASDIWGLKSTPVTISEMMRVPGVVKARAVLHSLLSRPLRAYRGDTLLDEASQPTWLYRTNSGIPPAYRLKAIIDDMIFRPASLLLVERGAVPENAKLGNILDATHIPFDRWQADQDGVILIDNRPANQDDCIWIPGPGPGLLAMASETARSSREMSKAMLDRVSSPFPMFELHETEDTGMTDAEVQDYVDSVVKARQSASRAVMFVPYNINVTPHGQEQTDLFESGRNAERIDWANYFNLPTSLLDGSVSTSTLTYSTQEGKRNEVFDYSVPYWLSPITSRLSMDDVVPRGQRIDMDFTDLFTSTMSPSGPTEQD